ncbi:MAG: thioredoxin family protein [Verrucomicrobiota bacterium]|nr:thioredoxin family protein [Limisphaera sp.]MDW8381360.1 thioredoxin family protein [Verrucomicrobiota bacterium]
MNTRLRHWLCACAVVLGSWLTTAAEPVWLEDLPQALEKAKAEKKQVLVNFTGSDWCGFCIRLKKDVFDGKEFAEYANKRLVLVEVDFPRKKQQSEARKSANEKLSNQYKVEGFPTLVLLDANGKELRRMVGYSGGGFATVKKRLRLPD